MEEKPPFMLLNSEVGEINGPELVELSEAAIIVEVEIVVDCSRELEDNEGLKFLNLLCL